MITENKHTQFLNAVRIKNYKSIAKCDISLFPLTILVGRNGSGKSNFLDALRFIVDGLDFSLDHAFKSRGGIDAVRRHSTGHPRNFSIGLDLRINEEQTGYYGFEIRSAQKGGFAVKKEQAKIISKNHKPIYYNITDGKITSTSEDNLPKPTDDRLFLVTASGLIQFRSLYDSLRSMGFYNLNPEQMKELQNPDAGELLHRDGSNIASVLERLRRENKEIVHRISEYLEKVVPGITSVERKQFGPKEMLMFKQNIKGASHPWEFYASSMSDGTLRTLGSLIAVMQLNHNASHVKFVGIEEPETALHPAAVSGLLDALVEASQHTQIAVTSHSPDLLDNVNTDDECILVVTNEGGITTIAPIDSVGRDAIKNHLYTAGELQRMDYLKPDEDHIMRQNEQPSLFDHSGI